MDENFSTTERTGTEKARMKKRLVWLIASMRYGRSPSKTLDELGELICQMVLASNKFTKKGKAARNLLEMYLSSESGGYSTDGSSKEKEDTERTLWYENQRKIIIQHNQDCEMGRNSEIRNMSCRKCFPIQEITGNSDFLEFWEWYREIMDAEIFTGETVRIFNELKAVMLGDRTDMNEENFVELTLLSLSIRYNKKPKYDIWEISLEIIKILSVSRKFRIGIKKTIEKLEKEKVISEGESSRPKKEIHEKDSEVITIYVNKKGIFNITGTGKEFRIEIDENNDEKRISGNEVIELCGSTKEDMNSVFEEIDKLVQELNERQKEILEDEFDEFENVINRSGFGPLKNSESKKESQELETESESEEEPLIVNPLVNMALNIIKVRKFKDRKSVV